MIEHADEVIGQPDRVDVCIVGAGAAGITLALDLAEVGAQVLLLEGGEQNFDARSAALYQGQNVGLPLRFGTAEMSLDSIRLRYLGGSTNHWSGMCHPLDDHDFEVRPHLPWSGWPLGASELSAHYERAQVTCELGPEGWAAATWFDRTFPGPPLLTGDGVRPVVYRFSPPTRFGERYGPKLESMGEVRLLLGANAVRVADDGRRATGIEVRTFGGKRFLARASSYVLATGGLEIPRLLLSSTDTSPAGLGNDHDLVGRMFMEHPHFVGGRIVLVGTADELAPYQVHPWPGPPGTIRTWVGLALDAATQEREGLGNATVFAWRDGGERAMGDGALAPHLTTFTRTATGGTDAVAYTAFIRTESVPDPASRVTLSDDVDELGMRRLRLDWRVGDFEWHTARETLRLVGQALGHAGRGRVELDPGGRPFRPIARLEMGNHHMGTTRMSARQDDGVVDPNCRLHTVENLYVAGSSVFPTVGAANPTLTIVALAHRLADHLAGGA